MDYSMFFNILNEQIEKGLLETLTYSNSSITTTIRDGNIIKKYTYDFNLNNFDNSLHNNHLDTLKRSIYKIVSLYKENPNSSLISEQKYIWLIYDILDGDRIPKIDNKDEILRVFEVYNSHKDEFLESLIDNVVFCDENGNIIDYHDRLRKRKIDAIWYDVLNQMEVAIYLFAAQNNAEEIYQEYLDKLYIPRREIIYKYTDEEGNEIEMPLTEEGTIFSLGKDVIEQGITFVKENVLKRIRKKLPKD